MENIELKAQAYEILAQMEQCLQNEEVRKYVSLQSQLNDVNKKISAPQADPKEETTPENSEPETN